MDAEFDIVVVGAGVAGLAAAALFARRASRVAVLAADLDIVAASGDIALRNFAISPAAARLLDHCGAWSLLDRARLGRYDALEIRDAGSDGWLDFARPAGDAAAMGWIIEDAHLRAALNASASARGVQMLAGRLVELSTGNPVRVQLDDGRRITARALIGADGAASVVRTHLPVRFDRQAYDQQAVVANVISEQPHRNIARQRFLPSGPLAFLPLAAADASSIVWSAQSTLASELAALDAAGFGARLGAAFEYRLGTIVDVSERATFDLACATLDRWYDGNVVLVGDAAHVIHPLAGQGLNQGLMDVAALYECVGTPVAGRWPHPSALARYQRWRKSEALQWRLATDNLNRLFAQTAAPWCRLRGAGLELARRLPGVTRYLAAVAMGEAGDMPKLVARNQPL